MTESHGEQASTGIDLRHVDSEGRYVCTEDRPWDGDMTKYPGVRHVDAERVGRVRARPCSGVRMRCPHCGTAWNAFAGDDEFDAPQTVGELLAEVAPRALEFATRLEDAEGVADLIDSACDAEEVFDLDELEEYAEAMRGVDWEDVTLDLDRHRSELARIGVELRGILERIAGDDDPRALVVGHHVGVVLEAYFDYVLMGVGAASRVATSRCVAERVNARLEPADG